MHSGSAEPFNTPVADVITEIADVITVDDDDITPSYACRVRTLGRSYSFGRVDSLPTRPPSPPTPTPSTHCSAQPLSRERVIESSLECAWDGEPIRGEVQKNHERGSLVDSWHHLSGWSHDTPRTGDRFSSESHMLEQHKRY